MDLIYERTIRQSKPLPDFNRTGPYKVFLTLQGTMTDESFVRFLENIATNLRVDFTVQDFLVVDLIRREQGIPTVLRPRLPRLRDLGVIEPAGRVRGSGARYLLSRGLYTHLRSAGTYTRKRGLDRETNKALLVKHLSGNGGIGAPLAELRQVLPTLSESAVQRLLDELRSEGRVYLAGSRRWARWRASTSKAPVLATKSGGGL